ncbi:helix-turn-helix domain-containing protein [Nocardia seriolae]|nr:PucR family transcriptional regulator [Nocardia seriolae]MTJ72280.1 PucR family transcriptional regulator [Nocardia seriolae]MTJ88379.1 PucR family transcriptional regulator [Nocardia seriolae]MTK32364.1 PucR family transcriptional regulator [Nocardia seriolae]MTK41705.1 PucR family transcriptional regulator [Nocardia seriolae]
MRSRPTPRVRHPDGREDVPEHRHPHPRSNIGGTTVAVDNSGRALGAFSVPLEGGAESWPTRGRGGARSDGPNDGGSPSLDLDRPVTAVGAPLRELLDALGSTLVELLDAPRGDEVPIRSVALVDGADLASETVVHGPVSDMYLHVGIAEAEAVRWLRDLEHRPAAQRARVVLSKTAVESDGLRRAASAAGVAVVAVHPRARWDHVYPLIRRMLERSGRARENAERELLGTDTDLFGLAQIIAQNAGGMVTIEDAQSHVLAYSASNEAADRLRVQSILGREGPREYLRILQQWGVFDRLRNSDEVVDLPAHADLDIKHRLAVGIRRAGESSGATVLGSIWLQEGERPFKSGAAEVLRGASAIAARIISRGLDAPSTEALLIQRLFGARGGGVDVPSVASALGIPVDGPAAVIGFALVGAGHPDTEPSALGSTLRLRASAFRRDSLTARIGERAYILLPRFQSARGVTAWTRQLVDQLEATGTAILRAAIAIPVPDLGEVARARLEVDRVLDSTAFSKDRVTTLAESRTAVLLGEILDLIADRPELHDPRLTALFDYDRGHAAQLETSVNHYLRHHGDVRAAATALSIHPNTLRYRLRRAQDITGIDLDDPADRLLLELQLARHRRGDDGPH